MPRSSIIYKATLKSSGIIRHYYGCSETAFKTRFNNHKQSFAHRHKRNATELSKAVWNAKDAGKIPPSNGASRPKPVHINREQNRAISVLPRSSLFYDSTPPQRSIKDQSLATNDATKTSSNRKFYYVVCLSNVMPNAVSISSYHVTIPRILLMQCPPVLVFLRFCICSLTNGLLQ